LPTDYTFNIREFGRHIFSNTTLKTAGSQSLTATDTVTSTITGSQTGITVNPAAPSSLVVAGFSSPTTAGMAGTFTVTAKDAFSNTAPGHTGTLHPYTTLFRSVLPANSTYIREYGRQHFSSTTLKTAGSQSLTATD